MQYVPCTTDSPILLPHCVAVAFRCQKESFFVFRDVICMAKIPSTTSSSYLHLRSRDLCCLKTWENV